MFTRTPSYLQLQHNTYEGIGIYDRTEEHCLPRKLLLTLISKSSNTHTHIHAIHSSTVRAKCFLAKNTFCFAPKSVFYFCLQRGTYTRRIYLHIIFKILPKIPIPALEDTIQRYLASAKPLLSDEEFEVTSSVASDFCTREKS